MKRYTFAPLIALTLSIGLLPVAALAEDSGSAENVTTQVRVQQEGTDVGVTAGATTSLRESGDQQRQQEQVNKVEATSSVNVGEEASNDQNIEQGQEPQEINLELEDDSNPATSFEDLNQKIEIRKNQLAQEVASSTEADKNIVENANQVRLAVHALLASKELVGGIGPQVSEIAKQMNDSVATTTNAEAKIQSRGFLTRFFFGGDSTSAEIISQEVAQNQQRIDDLTKLLGQANVSADVQATLSAQITALQDAQVRLQDLAQKEQKAWGLFSWRF